MRHRYFMSQALLEARVAAGWGEVPVGAVAVKDGTVISRAGNRRENWGDPTAHAELLVMRQCAHALGGWRLGGVTIYVTLEPCAMCAGAMVQARVGGLVYGASDFRGGAAGSLYNLVEDPRFNYRVPTIAGVREDECRSLLEEFFEARR